MLAHEVEGTGPAVILIHGLTFERKSWRPIVERLKAHRLCVTVDLPGHGESAGPPRPLGEVAALVHEVAESLSLVRPLVVGHSMAAAIAAFYGAAHPTSGIVNV